MPPRINMDLRLLTAASQAPETDATVRQGYLRNCLLPSGLASQPQRPSRLGSTRHDVDGPELPDAVSQLQAKQDSLSDVLVELTAATVVPQTGSTLYLLCLKPLRGLTLYVQGLNNVCVPGYHSREQRCQRDIC